MNELVQLINNLMSNDNVQRQQAEQSYQRYKTQNGAALITELMKLLLQQVYTSNENQMHMIQIRAFCAVLLRKLVEHTNGIWSTLSKPLKQSMKEGLIHCVQVENISHINMKIAHVIAELACTCQYIEETWDELLPSIFGLVQSNNVLSQVIGLEILTRLGEYAGNFLRPYENDLKTLYYQCLCNNQNNLKLQVASLKALVSFLLLLEDSNQFISFQDFIPSMLQVIETVLRSNDEMVGKNTLLSFLKIVEVHPTFFRQHIEMVVNSMLTITKTNQFDEGLRELSMEFIVSLCENAGGMIRKYPKLIEQIIPLCIELISELDEDDQWHKKFDDAFTFNEFEDDEAIISELGASSLHRITKAIGGLSMVPIVLNISLNCIQSLEWKIRRAGIYAFSILGENCTNHLFLELDKLMLKLIPFIQDVHPRVRHMTLHCLGQYADDFKEIMRGDFQSKYSKKLIPQYLWALQENQEFPRIQAIAASSIVNFFHPTFCKPSSVGLCMESLLSSLFNVINSSPRQVQEQAITAIGCIACVLKSEFMKYYPIFVPLAKQVLLHAKGKEYSLLRGKSMEAIALIGQAVGKEKFVKDAHEILNIFFSVQGNENECESYEINYISQACARIGNVLRENFLIYLPMVIPTLLKQAQTPPDFHVCEEDDLEKEDVNKNVQNVIIETQEGQKRINIKTSSLEEKLTACNMLYQYALDLEGNFLPYVEQVAKVLIPLIEFKYMENIRIVCALTMQQLLRAAIEGCQDPMHMKNNPRIQSFPQALFDEFFPSLINALQTEDDLECLGAICESISSCLELCKEAADYNIFINIQPNVLPEIFEIFRNIMELSASRRMQQQYQNELDEDYDVYAAEQQEESIELEDGIFTCMVDSIGWIIKKEKSHILPLLKTKIISMFQPFLRKEVLSNIQGQIICMMDDIIEHCSPQAHSLLEMFLPFMIQGIKSPEENIRRAAAYGMKVCAQHAGPTFDKYCEKVMRDLIDTITNKNATNSQSATDNAISAVSKLCIYRSNIIDVSKILPMWLSWLPLMEDAIEAREVHAMLVDMVECGDENIFGRNYCNLTRILVAFGSILDVQAHIVNKYDYDEEECIIDDETKERMQKVLFELQKQLPESIMKSAWSALSPQQRNALNLSHGCLDCLVMTNS